MGKLQHFDIFVCRNDRLLTSLITPLFVANSVNSSINTGVAVRLGSDAAIGACIVFELFSTILLGALGLAGVVFWPPDNGLYMKRILKLDELFEVSVEIFDPEIDPETYGHYICRYKINGLDNTLNGYAMGVDSIQAFYLTLQLIGNRLYTTNEFKNSRLRWPCSIDRFDLGFPVAN